MILILISLPRYGKTLTESTTPLIIVLVKKSIKPEDVKTTLTDVTAALEEIAEITKSVAESKTKINAVKDDFLKIAERLDRVKKSTFGRRN